MKTSQFTEKFYDGLCCPERGYKNEDVFAIIRVSSHTRYVFTDGRTLTVAPKTRYATFPRQDSPPENAVQEAMQELREKHPITSNLYVARNDRAMASLTLHLFSAKP